MFLLLAFTLRWSGAAVAGSQYQTYPEGHSNHTHSFVCGVNQETASLRPYLGAQDGQRVSGTMQGGPEERSLCSDMLFLPHPIKHRLCSSWLSGSKTEFYQYVVIEEKKARAYAGESVACSSVSGHSERASLSLASVTLAPYGWAPPLAFL